MDWQGKRDRHDCDHGKKRHHDCCKKNDCGCKGRSVSIQCSRGCCFEVQRPRRHFRDCGCDFKW